MAVPIQPIDLSDVIQYLNLADDAKLETCFDNAQSNAFDSNYQSSSDPLSPPYDLLDFRNYEEVSSYLYVEDGNGNQITSLSVSSSSTYYVYLFTSASWGVFFYDPDNIIGGVTPISGSAGDSIQITISTADFFPRDPESASLSFSNDDNLIYALTLNP